MIGGGICSDRCGDGGGGDGRDADISKVFSPPALSIFKKFAIDISYRTFEGKEKHGGLYFGIRYHQNLRGWIKGESTFFKFMDLNIMLLFCVAFASRLRNAKGRY